VRDQFQTLPQQPFDFGVADAGMLVTNAFARHIAGEFVQFKRQRQPLFARHLAVAVDLGLQCGLRRHRGINLAEDDGEAKVEVAIMSLLTGSRQISRRASCDLCDHILTALGRIKEAA